MSYKTEVDIDQPWLLANMEQNMGNHHYILFGVTTLLKYHDLQFDSYSQRIFNSQ